MKQATVISPLKSIVRKYQLARTTEVVLWSTAAAVLTFFTVRVLIASNTVAGIIAFVLGIVVASIQAWQLQLFRLTESRLANFLNRKYPELRESADLMLKGEEELSTLQRLQRLRTMSRFDEIYPIITVPHHAGRAAIALVISLAVGTLLTSFLATSKSLHRINTNDKGVVHVKKQFFPASVKAAIITISPPGYMQSRNVSSSQFNLHLPEGSKVKWMITFTGAASQPKIIFSARDTIPLKAVINDYWVERTFFESGFYQLTWEHADGTKHYSDFYELDVKKDTAPLIEIRQPSQHLALTMHDNPNIHLTSSITDDYGLGEASIIATVSKGSGEAVKFREEKLKFDKPNHVSGKRVQASRLLDLNALGLTPGDELYFYVEASDNKLPIANRTRSETYFVTLQDTSSFTNSAEASLGVDLMPEYFRSQRQIIIDSEKLLREKKQITKQNFNERSNELGYDQKVLRLRYGEFLGEEFESSIGPHGRDHDQVDDEDIQKEFGHEHDGDNEHNLVEDKKAKVPQQSGTLEDFVHAHDGEEEATFFVQSIKAKLKAAVTIMWDAELYLRLYQPEKSLPFQYKALKLLKEISQDSRIYVHRTGFDPPPLKEDKRLTGDLSEISNATSKVQITEKEKKYPAIRAAVALLESLVDDDTIALSERTKEILTKTGTELAQLELTQPGRYLKTLSLLNQILQDKVIEKERRNTLINIRRTLWKVLPIQSNTPSASTITAHELDREFLKSLEKAKSNN